MKSISVGTFNVRGICEEQKQRNLATDLENYNIDILCIQESKISNGTDRDINKHRLITFKTDNRHYGNGFLISSQWKENIHRLWKVSDRIAVLQLTTKTPEYTSTNLGGNRIRITRKVCYQSKLIQRKPRRKLVLSNYESECISDTKLVLRKTSNAAVPVSSEGQRGNKPKSRNEKLRMRISKTKPKNIITIINVYAPHSGCKQEEISKFYDQLDATKQKIDKERTSGVVLFSGDFNARVGQAKGATAETCLGSFSKGWRNANGQLLIDFCNRNDLFAGNTAFDHRSRHLTTWESVRTNRCTGKVTRRFHQIDFILCDRNQKRLLQNARSYAGTATFSDHRLVKAVMRIDPFIVFKRKPQDQVKRYNIAKLNEHAVREDYKSTIRTDLNNFDHSDDRVDIHAQQHWDIVSNAVKAAAENVLGFAERTKQYKRTHDPIIEALSIHQKDIRMQITTCTNSDKIASLRTQRNRIMKQIKRKVLANRELLLDQIVDDMERFPDHTKIFKATKAINSKTFQNPIVYDSSNKTITNPQAMYEEINTHFNKHFYDPSISSLEPFVGEPASLQSPITVAEVASAAKKLNNSRAPGIDHISAEMIKYGPPELHRSICEILNNALQKHQNLELGNGILVPLQKPGKDRGPVKNLRPVILLIIIRKLLSNIVLERIRPQYEQYISPSQSAYRANRSTADLVWAHRFMIAKALSKQVTIYITGLDLSSAFDTIRRDELIKILGNIINDDEVRMIRLLLSNTTLNVKMNNADTAPFESNVGSPQGDAISGVLFNIYLEDALRRVRTSLNSRDSTIEHTYVHPRSSLPREMCYADDSDYPTLDTIRRDEILAATFDILPQRNLKVNPEKTEHTIIERGSNEKDWRTVRKLGSLLGDQEDIAKRKQLSIAGMNELNNVWIRHDRIRLRKRLNLYKQLVKMLLVYNCSTWGMRKKDEASLDAFHRQQLRRMLRIRWPHRIHNARLYELTNESPISLFVTRQRWTLLGHILRQEVDTPANQAMDFYFEETVYVSFQGHDAIHGVANRGGVRTTLATTIDRDIKRAFALNPNCPLQKFTCAKDLSDARAYAQNRCNWEELCNYILEAAQAETPHGRRRSDRA